MDRRSHGGDETGPSSPSSGEPRLVQSRSAIYAEWVVLRGLQIDTFTKHSAVSLDFGVPNDSSTKTKRRSIGDLPDSSAYWANYVLHAGIKFDWAYVPDESAAYRRRFGGSL